MVTLPPKTHAVGWRILIDEHRIENGVFQALNSAFVKRLIFFGGVIVSIFLEIAHLDCRVQSFGNLDATHFGALCQFVFQILQSLLSHSLGNWS